MDFTFLFVVLLMLFAVKSQLWYVAVGLFLVLLVTSKSKYLVLAAVVGVLVAFAAGNSSLISIFGDAMTWVILGGLFLVLLLLAKKDSDHPSQEGYGPPGY